MPYFSGSEYPSSSSQRLRYETSMLNRGGSLWQSRGACETVLSDKMQQRDRLGEGGILSAFIFVGRFEEAILNAEYVFSIAIARNVMG